MKKLFAIMLAVVMVVSMVAVLAACDNTIHKCEDRCEICGGCLTECEDPACATKCAKTHDKNNPTTVAEKVYAAKSMTKAQLEAAAEAEFKAAGIKFTAKATTSGVSKVLKEFKKDYTWFDYAEFASSKDQVAYQDLDSTLAKGGYYADMAMIQIASKWQPFTDRYLMLNYVPQNDDEIQLSADATKPLVGLYADKLFAYSKSSATVKLENMWQLTGKDGKTLKKVTGSSLQDPTQEGINMAFLTMLTSDEACKKLATAYQNYFGTAYKNQKGCKNIGYYFIQEYIAALTDNHDSDSKVLSSYIAADTKGTVYVVGLNKTKGYSHVDKDGDTVTKNYWHEEVYYTGVDGDVDGYNGFTYNTYLGIPVTSKLPYTACLFARYILTEKGFRAGWKDVGYSSPNAKVSPNVDKTAGNYSYELDVTKVLQEDINWTATHTADVNKFVSAKWKNS